MPDLTVYLSRELLELIGANNPSDMSPDEFVEWLLAEGLQEEAEFLAAELARDSDLIN